MESRRSGTFAPSCGKHLSKSLDIFPYGNPIYPLPLPSTCTTLSGKSVQLITGCESKKNKKKTKINISCFGCWFVFAFSNLWASNFFPAHIIPCQRVTRKERLSYYHRSDDFCIYPHHFRTGNTKQTIYYMLILQIKSLIWKRQGEMDCHLLFC